MKENKIFFCKMRGENMSIKNCFSCWYNLPKEIREKRKTRCICRRVNELRENETKKLEQQFLF